MEKVSNKNKKHLIIKYLSNQKNYTQKYELESSNYKDTKNEICNMFKITNDFNLYDVIQTGNIPSPDNELIKESVNINIIRALSKLSQREAKIITMSYGLSGTPIYSLQDIATYYNMSSERIRQIKDKSLTRLKIIMSGNHSFMEN